MTTKTRTPKANAQKPKRKGNQKPRIDQWNNGDIWLAQKVIDLMEAYGISLLVWQKLIIYRWMAVVYDEESDSWKWANPKAGLLVPRQNGKTEILIARIIGGMIFMNEALIYTAHSDKTVDETKRRVQRFFYDAKQEIRDLMTEEFDKEPKSLDYVELRDGGRCVFRTRTRTGGLGTTNDTLILDEAQEETDAQQEALLPTISAGKSQNQQLIRVGTPPSGGGSGTVFVRIRFNVIKGKDHETCWQEWSVELMTDPSDEDAWYNCNPSLGYHLMLMAVRNEAKDMAVDSFNKMRLGWIAGVETQRAISDDAWSALIAKQVAVDDEPVLVYAIKFAPDGSAVSLGVGVYMPNDRVHVEILERKAMGQGTHWITNWLFDKRFNRWKKCKKIIIDGNAGTQLLVEELVRTDKRISKKILTPNVKEAGAAYSAFQTGVEKGELTHYDQPLLNMSVKTVKKRGIGKDGMFGYASLNPDIQSDPTECAAFCFYGAVRFRNVKTGGGTKQSVGVQ
jgi:phage terminase large subunit-like protein